MLRSQRVEAIEQYVYERKKVSLDQLCEAFKVSKNTIRRDIEEIVARGNIRKVYGGVSVQGNKELLPFNERNITNLEAKRRVAAKAAAYVEDDDIVFIDSGTTTRHMIEFIKDKNNLTILTNNLDCIVSAVPYRNIKIISLSGILSRTTLSFTGHGAAKLLETYNIGKSFLASTGISLESGVTNSDPEEYEIKKVAIQRSKRTFLLVDNNKIGVVALLTYCDLKQIDYLVTDAPPPKAYYDYMHSYRRQILIADSW
jgi:DeoR family myo-inositol catabolism operon transcriptional repressor